MEENENKEEVQEEKVNSNETTVNKEELKNETVKTAKEVKETIKNVDIKEDAKATTGFITEMVKTPLKRLKEISEDVQHKDFKYAIVLIVVWMIVCAISNLQNYSSIDYFFTYGFTKHFLSLVKAIIAPALGIVVMSLIVFIMNKNNKKSFVTIMTSITSARIPIIIANAITLLTIFSTSIYRLTSLFNSFATIITAVFTYFAAKALFGEENDSKFIKTFAIIEAIYYVAYLLISYLEIYI